MLEASLYWIDDSAQDMYLIMEHVFPAIWDKGCSCKTILFGNDYCSKETEGGPNEAHRKAFESDLNGFFIVYCQEIDAHEWCESGTTYKAKKHLLPDPSVAVIPIKNDEPNSIRKLAERWMDYTWLEHIMNHSKRLRETERENRTAVSDGGEEPGAVPDPTSSTIPASDPKSDTVPVTTLEPDSPVSESIPEAAPNALREPGPGLELASGGEDEMAIDQLIAAMKIPDNAVVALDICLLYKDIDRIGADLPSISMALYAALSKNHRCYLYSNRSIARTVMDQWIATYQHVFGGSEKLTIHPKNGLTAKRADTDAKQDLLALLEGKE